jgi:NAD dependent epimerase/dehydratase family enzyme
MPWIHIEDEVGLILFLIANENAHGAFNGTAPNAVTMEEFCKALGNVLNRPCWAPVPASALTLFLGEMAEMLLTGQRAVPKAAQDLGYRFRYPSILEALQSLGL